MAMQALMTAEDLFKVPEDGYRCELVRGELRKIPLAGFDPGTIVMNLSTPLDQYVRSNRLGRVCAAETGFKLTSNPDTVLAPDVAFIRRERVEVVGNIEGYWPGASDLVVEVISPSDVYTDVEDKVLEWLNAGTHMVVVINPRQRVVTVYRSLTDITILTEEDILDGGQIVPGWTLPVREVFV